MTDFRPEPISSEEEPDRSPSSPYSSNSSAQVVHTNGDTSHSSPKLKNNSEVSCKGPILSIQRMNYLKEKVDKLKHALTKHPNPEIQAKVASIEKKLKTTHNCIKRLETKSK
jgi:hypothetical protein